MIPEAHPLDKTLTGDWQIPASPRSAFSTATPFSSSCLCLTSTCSNWRWMIWDDIHKNKYALFKRHINKLQNTSHTPAPCAASAALPAWPVCALLSAPGVSAWRWVPPPFLLSETAWYRNLCWKGPGTPPKHLPPLTDMTTLGWPPWLAALAKHCVSIEEQDADCCWFSQWA